MLSMVVRWIVPLAVITSQLTTVCGANLPAYLPHHHNSYLDGNTFDAELSESALSYYLGEGLNSQAEQSDFIARYMPSPFLDNTHPTIVLVQNFDSKTSESMLGSPNFFIDSNSIQTINGADGVKKITVGTLADTVRSGKNRIVVVDAFQDRINQNERILVVLTTELSDQSLLVIGMQQKGSEINQKSLSNITKKSLPYIKTPEFFETEDQCMSLTSNCSSRGSCNKSSNGRYTCKCKPTTKDGYTYYWGGVDCSKRDVSTQFNLIVGTTLGIAAASVLSISLLFKLGSQPLPGVLNTSSL